MCCAAWGALHVKPCVHRCVSACGRHGIGVLPRPHPSDSLTSAFGTADSTSDAIVSSLQSRALTDAPRAFAVRTRTQSHGCRWHAARRIHRGANYVAARAACCTPQRTAGVGRRHLMPCSSFSTSERNDPQCLPTAPQPQPPTTAQRCIVCVCRGLRLACLMLHLARCVARCVRRAQQYQLQRIRRPSAAARAMPIQKHNAQRCEIQHASSDALAAQCKPVRARRWDGRGIGACIDGRLPNTLAAMQVQLLQRRAALDEQRHHPCVRPPSLSAPAMPLVPREP